MTKNQIELVGAFFDIESKPTAVSQTCMICQKEIGRGDWRVRSQSGCSRAGMGCGPKYIYAHLRCFFQAFELYCLKLGLPVEVQPEAKKELRRIKKEVRNSLILKRLKP